MLAQLPSISKKMNAMHTKFASNEKVLFAFMGMSIKEPIKFRNQKVVDELGKHIAEGETLVRKASMTIDDSNERKIVLMNAMGRLQQQWEDELNRCEKDLLVILFNFIL